MNKKQIAALAMCVATAATAVVGGTLAYFTDNDKVENVFAIGDLDINLYENVGMKDSDGNVIESLETKVENGHTYNDLVPTYEIIKQPVIENTGSYDAYVRVAVVMNKAVEINNAIDEVYEKKDGVTEDDIQEIYDEVFDGWGISYAKRNPDKNDRRMWMDAREDDAVLGNIDTYCKLSEYGMFDVENQFNGDDDVAYKDGIDYDFDNYYANAVKENERIYVFYLKLNAGSSYTLFYGLNVPNDFNADQMAMFDGLNIDVYADAIQVAGFNTTTDEVTGETTKAYVKAFEALEAEHPLGWWNTAE